MKSKFNGAFMILQDKSNQDRFRRFAHRKHYEACWLELEKALSSNSDINDVSKGANMSAIYILIGCSLIVALGFLLAFIWAAKTGQFEDTYTPSIRMLFDEDTKPTSSTGKKQ